MVLKLRFNDFLEAREMLEGIKGWKQREDGKTRSAHRKAAQIRRECAAMMLQHLDAAIYSTCKALRGVA